jgi:hypothetical protein
MIVSGNGRNTGKTSFICEVIGNASKRHAVTAIKVSPHHHGNLSYKPIYVALDFSIREETGKEGIKDSSRMLISGASKVYYVESADACLADALDQLLPLIPPGNAVICESGGLRHLIEPSLFVLLNQKGREAKKPSYLELLPFADATVTFYGEGFDPAPESVDFNGTEWTLVSGF